MFEEPAYQWRDPEWRQAAEGWIDKNVAIHGGEVTGPICGVRFLPWSAVLRAPTLEGDVYFKACGPSQRHEPALAAFLAVIQPDCMIPVLAVDLEHDWFLMPDGGPTLTPAIRTPADGPDHWRRVLALIADLQLDLMGGVPSLLALGVPDRRPAVLPQLLDAILQQPERLMVGEPGALDQADIDRLLAVRPQVAERCAELVEIGPPDTYVHDDLHEDHIFTHQELDGTWRYRFYDFGDTCISHPFIQLVSQPRFVSERYGSVDDPDKISLYEYYLDRWADFASPPVLQRARRCANALGGIIRALTWFNACANMLEELSPHLREYYKDGIAFWLRQVGIRIEGLNDR